MMFFVALHLLSNVRGSTGEVWMRRMKKEDKNERGIFILWIGFGKLHKIFDLYYAFLFSLPAIMLSCVRKRKRDKKSGPRSIVTGQESVVMDRTQTMKYHQTHSQLPLAIELWDQIWNRERKRKREREMEFMKLFLLSMHRSIVQERRKQLIQESKFLGGDMQHTHLVKGLDYVLLDKVGVTYQRYDSNIILHLCLWYNYRCAVRFNTSRER